MDRLTTPGMPTETISETEPPPLTAKLLSKKAHFEKELAKVNKALDLLTKNKELQELFDAVSSIGY